MPLSAASLALAEAFAFSGLALIHSLVFTVPASTASTTSGCSLRNFCDTMTFVITNFFSGHRAVSSRRTEPPSETSLEAVGSGTQAPSMEPCLKASGVTLLSVRTTETSPLPDSGSTVQPFSEIQLRNATSCVFPFCGVAIFLPLRSSRVLILSGFTTSFTPPDAEPEMIRRLEPLDFT